MSGPFVGGLRPKRHATVWRCCRCVTGGACQGSFEAGEEVDDVGCFEDSIALAPDVALAQDARRFESVDRLTRAHLGPADQSCSALDSDHRDTREEIETLDARWREQLGRVRANSAVELLLDLLPGVPVITVESAARLIGRSEMRTGEAVNRLEAAGILRQRNVGRQRYRVFEAADVVELFTGLERALASPTGDTATAAPTRRVPRRVNRIGDEVSK